MDVCSKNDDQESEADEKEVIALSNCKIGHEIIGTGPQKETYTKWPAIPHKSEEPHKDHIKERPEGK